MNPKYLISLCIGLIIIAFIIKCSNDVGDVEYKNPQKEVPVVPLEANVQETEDNEALEEVVLDGVDDVSIENNRYEIPRLTKSMPEQILSRVGYTTSYNNETKNANWVAWHLTKEHTSGPWKRDGIDYIVDGEVIGARQECEDWFGHGLPIDHGHMCPAGDSKWSEEAMLQSFLLTNMCPQNSSLNNGDWKELEERCRGWARHYGEVYIACGPIFYSKNSKTIGDNKVGVPDAFFKVVLHLGKRPQALGFIYPNEGIHHNMSYYVLSVDEVERTTGIDFFYNLPDEIENVIESFSDIKRW